MQKNRFFYLFIYRSALLIEYCNRCLKTFLYLFYFWIVFQGSYIMWEKNHLNFKKAFLSKVCNYRKTENKDKTYCVKYSLQFLVKHSISLSWLLHNIYITSFSKFLFFNLSLNFANNIVVSLWCNAKWHRDTVYVPCYLWIKH